MKVVKVTSLCFISMSMSELEMGFFGSARRDRLVGGINFGDSLGKWNTITGFLGGFGTSTLKVVVSDNEIHPTA